MTDVPLLAYRCAEHRRPPRARRVMTLTAWSWAEEIRRCERCRALWAQGHGPGSAPEVGDEPPDVSGPV